MEGIEEGKERKTFALICRGDPEDFSWLIEQAKIGGLYVVFTKTSHQKLIVEEASW